MSIRTENFFVVICDKCEEKFGHGDSPEDIRESAAMVDEWKQIDGKDYCPNCAWKIERKADER